MTNIEEFAERLEGHRPLSGDDAGKILEIARARLNRRHTHTEYPTEALGPLAQAAQDLANAGQMEPAIAAQSMLAAAALCAQACANAETLTGKNPLSLYLLTIAESGDGKTLAEDVALSAVRKFQCDKGSAYREALKIWKRSKPDDRDDEPPRTPYSIMHDATIEGIRRSFVEGIPSQGVFSSEAAVVLTGYGMLPEHKAKTAGELNSIWDRGEISATRGTQARIQLFGRRLSAHLMIQPAAVRASLFDDLFAAMGFWPRFLLAWPKPASPRKAAPFNPERISSIGKFWRRCHELLPEADRDDCDNLHCLTLTDGARRRVEEFFETMEVAAKAAGGRYEAIKPFAIRAPQQACRIAGVISVFAGDKCIGGEAMQGAILLAAYSVDEWRSAFGEREESEAAGMAVRYLEWILKERQGRVTKEDILRNGPRPRGKDTRDRVLSLLHASGFMDPIPGTVPTTWRVRTPQEIEPLAKTAKMAKCGD